MLPAHETSTPPIETTSPRISTADWLAVLVQPGQVVELRAFAVDGITGRTVGGYFDYEHLDAMAQAAAQLSGRARGVYSTLNPVNPALLARSPNHVRRLLKGDGAEDKDVLKRQWLFIDIDRRQANGSATDEERAMIRRKTAEVRAYLTERGWPAPVLTDSGNGFHLLYRIDLPTQDNGLIRRVLHVLAAHFDDDAVSVDKSVFNPARLDKVYGTLACKGEPTTDRPHRVTAVIEMPSPLSPVPAALLEGLAAQAPAEPHLRSGEPEQVQTVLNPANQDVVLAAARLYVSRMAPSIEGCHGDRQTYKVARVLTKDFDLPVELAFPILVDYNRTCTPPWDPNELRRKLEKARDNPGPKGKLLAGLRLSPRLDEFTPLESIGCTPFMGVAPDFVQGDWLLVKPEPRPLVRGHPRTRRGVLWAIREGVRTQRRSQIILPAELLGQVVWGGEAATWPRNWRQTLRKWLTGLIDSNESPCTCTCPPECPWHDRDRRHGHFRIRISTLRDTKITGQGPETLPMGALELFGFTNEHGEWCYDWSQHGDDHPAKAYTEEATKLRKAGRICSIYLPVQLFGSSSRSGLSWEQRNLLAALTRETTRSSRSDRTDKAETFRAGGRSGSHVAFFPSLQTGTSYVAFNGNGRRRRKRYRGMGYQLIGKSNNGWLAKAGYAIPDDQKAMWAQVRKFLEDLIALQGPFGLVAGAYHAAEQKWIPLDELVGLTRTKAGRVWLQRCLLRVFTEADYLTRWRRLFAERLKFTVIPGDSDEPMTTSDSASAIRDANDLHRFMARAGITDQELATKIGKSRSYVSGLRSGRRRWSKKFEAQVTEALALAGNSPG